MIVFILNLPWTLLGLMAAIPSIPRWISVNKKPFAIVVHVRSLWWYAWLPGYAKVRAMALGNVVLLNPRADEKDLVHELIHVEQYGRLPFIFPILSFWESQRKGYRRNKYEAEAYDKSGSRYEA
jgi:hypothetical protein